MTPSSFKVLVRDLPAHRTVQADTSYAAEVLKGLPMRDALGDGEAGSATLDADLYTEGANVHVAGTVKGEVVVACSRCLGPARIPVDETVRVTFMPASEIQEKPAETDGQNGDTAEAGVELTEEDLDVFPYDGEAVDLEPLIREQLVLSVPYAPLCREDCKGLCPQCGVDRNVTTCTCEPPGDPRFAALKGLKLPT